MTSRGMAACRTACRSIRHAHGMVWSPGPPSRRAAAARSARVTPMPIFSCCAHACGNPVFPHFYRLLRFAHVHCTGYEEPGLKRWVPERPRSAEVHPAAPSLCQRRPLLCASILTPFCASLCGAVCDVATTAGGRGVGSQPRRAARMHAGRSPRARPRVARRGSGAAASRVRRRQGRDPDRWHWSLIGQSGSRA